LCPHCHVQAVSTVCIAVALVVALTVGLFEAVGLAATTYANRLGHRGEVRASV
jgi:hypothetical protein